MTVHLEHDAELEMLEAARHYEEQQSGLGSDFLDEVDFSLEQIRRGAERFGFYRRSKIVRSVRLERFPYRLLFVVEAELAIVVAVMHLHRRPDYWKKRIR
jgi:mRNA-degrading endonuclease RelE of RelBE toxin-antitoxin system